MIAGRKPKPTQLRIVEGNREHRPINEDEPKPRPLIPSCPSWLDKEAKREWQRIAKQLHTLGILTEIDRVALAAYCQCYSKWRQAEAKAKIEIYETENGYQSQSPYINIANKYLRELRALMAEFGMTPSSRSRIHVQKQDEGDEDLD